MSLCPEAAHRAAMDNAEFWEHVFNDPPTCDPRHDEYAFGVDQDELDALTRLAAPCPECGQHGACAWDVDGRPLIHATEDTDHAGT